MKIGIMGGTFNPIHNGHLILSEYVKEEEKLDKIIFIPAGEPPHKTDKNILSSNHRKKMVDLAIKNNNDFISSNIEIKNKGLSYTIDTLNILEGIYENSQLNMILGADSLINLKTWKNYQEIIDKVKILVVGRFGKDEEKLNQIIKDLNIESNGCIKKIDTPLVEISSTRIRQRVRNRKSIKYLVPEDVENYIIDNSLYVCGENNE